MSHQYQGPLYIISTDLDGTLLDHHSYRWQAAIPAIRLLVSNAIPIIFNTSKTLREAADLQKEIGISGPIIAENGSVLAIPESSLSDLRITECLPMATAPDKFRLIVFGRERKAILQFIKAQRALLGMVLEGFNDWNLETIADNTGMPLEKATLAALKDYSEPFIWLADDHTFEKFKNSADHVNLKILEGGRFYHLQGNTDKARPLHWLRQRYFTREGARKTPVLVCLGDNKNDIQMLDAADIPVCVKSPTSPYPKIATNPKAIYTKAYGPEGWKEAIYKILSKELP